MKIGNWAPLTRPAPAGESAGAGHPLPQGGEGRLFIFMHSGEPKDHGVCARNDIGSNLKFYVRCLSAALRLCGVAFASQLLPGLLFPYG
jgi:hypothetical protein